MCGIAGLINLNGDAVSPVILKKMTDAIAHRGPDGEGSGLRVMWALVIGAWPSLISAQLDISP